MFLSISVHHLKGFCNPSRFPSYVKLISIYLFRHFVNVSQHEEFINLPADKLVEIISSDDLEVDKEEETFAAVLRWLHHDLSGRQDHLHKVRV